MPGGLPPSLEGLKLKLALTTAPFSASPVYVDVAPYCKVLQVKIGRGRSQETEQFRPGTLDVVIRDTFGAWDVDWASNPVFLATGTYPEVDQKLQLALTFLGTDTAVYTGFVEFIGQGHPDFGWDDDIVTVRCADGLALLANKLPRTDFDTEETTGVRLRKMLDDPAVGWPGTGLMTSAGHRDLDTGTFELQGQDLTTGRQSVRDAAYQAELSEWGQLFCAADGTLRFIEHRAMFTEAVYSASQGTFGDGPGEMPYRDLKKARDVMRVRNSVTARRAGGAEQLAEDASSIEAHTLRGDELPQLLLLTDNEAADLAWYKLGRDLAPQTRLDPLLIAPEDDPYTLWPFLLSDPLRHRYTVKKRRKLLDDSVWSKEVHIENLDLTINCDAATAEAIIGFSTADPNTYWILGVAGRSELGTTSKWGR